MKSTSERTSAMADLAFAAAGGLPVRVNLPVPLQRPYAADPGTLTEWLVAKTTGLNRDDGRQVNERDDRGRYPA